MAVSIGLGCGQGASSPENVLVRRATTLEHFPTGGSDSLQELGLADAASDRQPCYVSGNYHWSDRLAPGEGSNPLAQQMTELSRVPLSFGFVGFERTITKMNGSADPTGSGHSSTVNVFLLPQYAHLHRCPAIN